MDDSHKNDRRFADLALMVALAATFENNERSRNMHAEIMEAARERSDAQLRRVARALGGRP